MTQEELLQLLVVALPPSEKLDICRHPTGSEPYRAGKSHAPVPLAEGYTRRTPVTDHVYVRFGADAFLISITPVRDIP